MRIALTMTRASDLGGVERQAHSVARALLDEGHEVHVFAQKRDDTVDERIVFHRIPNPGKPLRAAKVWLFDKGVERAVRREGPFDLVHGFAKTSKQDVYFDGSGCLADFQRYSIDRMPAGWRRSWRRHGLHQRVVARIERRRYTRGNFRRILAISEMVRGQILARHGLEQGDVETLYPGVDLDRFRPSSEEERRQVRREQGIPVDAPVFAFLGSDYRRKGLSTFLKTLTLVEGVHGLVIGRESPARERFFAEQAAAFGVAWRTHFLGVQPDPGRLLGAADCLLFPSHFDAFGQAVLEALACGVPAVVSLNAGAAELVADGKAGAVVADPTDAVAFAREAAPFLESERRIEAGFLARQEAEKHPWSRHVKRVLAIYADLLAEGA
ncbi:MAG: glycosyltransferase family 4 protein [Myxococcota bacterium]